MKKQVLSCEARVKKSAYRLTRFSWIGLRGNMQVGNRFDRLLVVHLLFLLLSLLVLLLSFMLFLAFSFLLKFFLVLTSRL